MPYNEANGKSCTRRLTFCAGHRVWGHESKCANIHGHNYVVKIEAEAEIGLDAIGRVVDFSVLKERVGGWIEHFWDHGFIGHREDWQVRGAVESIPGQKHYWLPYNPTAENMAAYLLEVICPQVLQGTGAVVQRVVIGETENCEASAWF